MSQTVISILIYGGIIAAFYYFFIRPQRQQKKEVEEMRQNLQKGDEIVSIGGVLAQIVNIEGDNLVIKTKPNEDTLTIKRWAVRQKIKK